MDDTQSLVVVVLKVALAFLSAVISALNASCYSHYKNMENIFYDFDHGDLPLCLAFFGFMSCLINIYGAIIFYVESNLKLRAFVRRVVYGYFVWEVALFCKYIVSAVCLFYAFQATGELFDDGFFEAMSKYKTDDKVKGQIDKVQESFDCCGNMEDGYKEWYKMNWMRSMGERHMGFPKSCCDVYKAEEVGSPTCLHEVPYQDRLRLMPVETGCLELVEWWYAFYLFVSAFLFTVAAFIQLISLLAETVLVTKGVDREMGQDEIKLFCQQHAIFDNISSLGTEI